MAATKSKIRQTGDNLDYTPSAATTAGAPVLSNDQAGIVTTDLAASELGSIRVRGVVDVNKDSSAFSAGDPVYWDNDGTDVGGATGGAATVVATGNFFLGRALEAAGTAATEVEIALNSIGAADANADITDNTAGTAAAALAAIEGTYTQATVADNFATLVTEQNAIKAALRAAGIIKP